MQWAAPAVFMLLEDSAARAIAMPIAYDLICGPLLNLLEAGTGRFAVPPTPNLAYFGKRIIPVAVVALASFGLVEELEVEFGFHALCLSCVATFLARVNFEALIHYYKGESYNINRHNSGEIDERPLIDPKPTHTQANCSHGLLASQAFTGDVFFGLLLGFAVEPLLELINKPIDNQPLVDNNAIIVFSLFNLWLIPKLLNFSDFLKEDKQYDKVWYYGVVRDFLLPVLAGAAVATALTPALSLVAMPDIVAILCIFTATFALKQGPKFAEDHLRVAMPEDGYDQNSYIACFFPSLGAGHTDPNNRASHSNPNGAGSGGDSTYEAPTDPETGVGNGGRTSPVMERM